VVPGATRIFSFLSCTFDAPTWPTSAGSRWLALATTRQGDIPLFCQALDGIASDKVSLVAAVEALAEQLHAAADSEGEAPLFVADSGLYSAENVARLTTAGMRWISRADAQP
jgi:transposase